MEPGTQPGPLNSGAPLDRPGYFYPPTIVTRIADGVRPVDEEPFGPALPTMPFGGTRWSGIGYQIGRWGLETYAALQVVELNRS